MDERRVSIGQIKRDISQLLNRVACGRERIVLTSRGKPKAVIVSLADYAHLKQADTQTQIREWESWMAANEKLTAKILAAREGIPVDVDAIWAESRSDLEKCHDSLFDN